MANEFRIKNGAISPNMVITDTTVSTSTATGALQVSGGAGIVGNVYAGAFYGAATGLTSIPGANVTGSVPSATSATTASTVTTNAQPNITSVGSLTSLTVAGNVTVASGIPFVKLVPTIPQIELGRTDGTASFPKIVFWSSASTAPSYDSRIYGSGGNGTDGSATLIFNSGANDFLGGRIRVVSNIGNSSSYHCGLFNDSSYITFYPKSTAGTFNPSVNVGDNSLIFSNGTINDSEMVIAPFANIASGIRISVSGQTTYGNITATGSFVGNASGLTSIPGANVIGAVPSATSAGTVTTAAQPNITSVGTLTGLTSSGIVSVTNTTPSTSTITGSLKTSGGMGVAGNVYASAFYGAATGLTSIPGANVSGAVPSATIASTVSTNAQPNITSVGSNLTVSSSLLLGRIDNTASTPTIEFNSGATSVDYDARILCSGGNGANDGGDLAVTASTFYIGAKFGYRTGMGLSVTQLTSRTTSVTINAPVGRITLVSATTTAGQISSFTVNNSYINSTDVVIFSKFSGSGYYIISTRSLAVGSFVVDVYTPVAVTSAEAPAFNFAILRGTLS